MLSLPWSAKISSPQLTSKKMLHRFHTLVQGGLRAVDFLQHGLLWQNSAPVEGAACELLMTIPSAPQNPPTLCHHVQQAAS